jgi:hypothetical protein
MLPNWRKFFGELAADAGQLAGLVVAGVLIAGLFALLVFLGLQRRYRDPRPTKPGESPGGSAESNGAPRAPHHWRSEE